MREDVTQKLSQVRPLTEEEREAMMQQMLAQQKQLQEAAQRAAQLETVGADANPAAARPGFDENDRSTWGNPGRNELCPCGSGKKFKHCHGRLT